MSTTATVTQMPKIDAAKQVQLGKALRDRFDRYASDRSKVEEQWLKNIRQFNGEYDPELLEKFAPTQSRAYPRITRVKVVSMVARLMSLLFPSGEKNWSLSPSPVASLDAGALNKALQMWAEENPDVPFDMAEFDQIVAKLAERSAKNMEKHIDDQLGDIAAYGPADYAAMVKQVVRSAVLFGPGVLKGPMTITEKRASIQVVDGVPAVQDKEVYRPYFEFVPVWAYYPDMNAKTFAQMDGQFQRHVFSRHQLTQLISRHDFKGSVIQSYLRDHPEGNYKRAGFEQKLAAIGSSEGGDLSETKKFEVVEWWGHVSGHDLRSAGIDVPENKLDSEITASVWLLDDKVIKAVQSPFAADLRMYHQFVFEEDDVNLLGTGLPQIMRDSQMSVASASRMLMDNASVVCGPNVEVDIDLLVAGQNMDLRPFKTWFKDGANANSAGRAVQSVTFEAHIPELLQVIKLFMDFADAETFVNPATGGDVSGLPSEAMRTSGGASMILGNAALPFRDVVRNFDRFTVSVIHSLVEWNAVFNEREDIVGDLRPIGRGATTLMAKEVRAYALDNLAQTLLEEEKDYVDIEQLVHQRLATRDLPLDSLLVSEKVAKERRAAREQSTAEAQDQQRQMFKAEMENMFADTFKQLAQGRKHLDAADVNAFRAALDALEKGVSHEAAARIAQGASPSTVPNQQEPRTAGGAPVTGDTFGNEARGAADLSNQ